MKLQNHSQQQSQHQPFSHSFYITMARLQAYYQKFQDETALTQLLCYYTDCVNYFETREESISVYFQQKIKELMGTIKIFGTAQIAEKNRHQMNNHILKAMHQEDIQLRIKQSEKKKQQMSQRVHQIVEDQLKVLQERIHKKRKTMAKCQSATMSFNSVETSADQELGRLAKEPGALQMYIFTIDSDEQQKEKG